MAGTYGRELETEMFVDDDPKLRSRASLSSVVIGTLVALSVGILLHLLGTAIGLSTVDAVDRDTPDATTMALMAGGWSLLANILALGTGGYVAARLSGNIDRQDAALNGLGVWAAAVALSATLATMLAIGAVGSTASAVGSVIGGTVRSAATVASGAVAGSGTEAGRNGPGIVDQLRATLTAPSDPQQMTTEQRSAEIAALIGRRVANGSFAAGERERLSALIAAEAGITPAEADQRIAAYEQQAREAAARAEEQARQAADAAATATAIASFWMFAALLIGAAAAVMGALQGARDGALRLARTRA